MSELWFFYDGLCLDVGATSESVEGGDFVAVKAARVGSGSKWRVVYGGWGGSGEGRHQWRAHSSGAFTVPSLCLAVLIRPPYLHRRRVGQDNNKLDALVRLLRNFSFLLLELWTVDTLISQQY